MKQPVRTTLLLSLALLVLAGCESADQQNGAGQAAGTSRADIVFIATAGTAVQEEIRFAQLAVTRAADESVHAFAAKVIADDTAASQQLAALAQRQGLPPPSPMDERHAAMYQELATLRGPGFDRTYMHGQLQDLTMLIQRFQAAADSGKDPPVRDFANQYLPKMLEQLRVAPRLAEQ